jgi:hypothetical protein
MPSWVVPELMTLMLLNYRMGINHVTTFSPKFSLIIFFIVAALRFSGAGIRQAWSKGCKKTSPKKEG